MLPSDIDAERANAVFWVQFFKAIQKIADEFRKT